MPFQPQDFKAAAVKRRKTAVVEIEGLEPVTLRALSAGDAVRFQTDVKKLADAGGNEDELSFTLIARSWVNPETGEALFPEDEGIEVARSLDPDAFSELTKSALRLNGISEKAIEDAEKNSGASRSGSMPIGSPENSESQT